MINEYFYKDASLKNIATIKDFEKPSRKYLWDGNNGDKWEITKRYGFPITFIEVKCLDQNKNALYQVRDITDNENYFPTNNN